MRTWCWALIALGLLAWSCNKIGRGYVPEARAGVIMLTAVSVCMGASLRERDNGKPAGGGL